MPSFEGSPANQFGPAGAYYYDTMATPPGVAQPIKQVFLHGTARHRKMNAVPILVSILVPWGLFCWMHAVTSFGLHYRNGGVCALLVVLGFLLTLSTVAWTIMTRIKWLRGASGGREPTWLIFLSASMLLAWVLGTWLGCTNYSARMRPYYDMHNLNEYTDVSVQTMRGQQLMDAGIVDFVEGSHLDISKSMGFKEKTMYCVAPITLGNQTLPTYDFWVVGTECCSGGRPDFHCPGAHGGFDTHSGLRLMADGSRAYYRLAVQQAEAAYKIKAFHPLFFEWVRDGPSKVESWRERGVANCIISIVAYLIAQCLLVFIASMLFAKIGQIG